MAVFRFLAALCLLVAVLALVTDMSALPAGQPFSVTSVSGQWNELAPATQQAARAAVRHATAAWVWDGLIGPLLSVPTFLLFGLLALWFGYLGRRRHKVNIYVN